jgi:hypothetical protein
MRAAETPVQVSCFSTAGHVLRREKREGDGEELKKRRN